MRQAVYVSSHLTPDSFAPSLWPASLDKTKAHDIARLEIIDGLSIQSSSADVFRRLAELCASAADSIDAVSAAELEPVDHAAVTASTVPDAVHA